MAVSFSEGKWIRDRVEADDRSCGEYHLPI
jgi:hypothetical protein